MIRNLLLGVGIVIGVLVLCTVLIGWVVSSADKPKGNHEEILKSKEQPPRKALIVYQPSITDISSRMAHRIANGLNNGGYEVTLNYPGKHLSSDISGYQLVVFGSAVHSGQPSKVLIDYMSGIKDYTSGRIVLYSTGQAPNNTKELDIMKKSLNGVNPYRTIKFSTRAKKENDRIAYELGKELSKK